MPPLETPTRSSADDSPDTGLVVNPSPRIASIAMAIAADAPPVSIDAAQAALFLDLDGTLADFAPTPHEVVADPQRSDLLRRLAQMLEGRIAVVSGRAISDIDRIIDRSLPHVAGVHGLERRDAAGALVTVEPHPALPEAVKLFGAIIRAYPGALLEVKPLSVALHYRSDPGLGPTVRQAAADFAAAHGLVLQEGHMVVELLTPGRDKGAAVKAFMEEAPFRGAIPIFLGDDLTDEKAFDAVLGLGGVGILVGPLRATSATAIVPGVADVLAWLAESLDQRRFRIGAAA